MRPYLPFLLLLLFLPASAQTSPSPTGSIRGNLVASDGASLAGVTLQYGRLAPRNPKAGPAMLPPVLTVTTAAAGAFSLPNLAPATYLVCVQVRGGAYLDPCHWSANGATFTVAAGETVTNAVLRVAKGYPLQVRVNDPQQTLASEGKVLGAHLQVGVWAPSGALLQGTFTPGDVTGRSYLVTVPFDQPVSVLVSGGAFRLSDSSGVPLAAAGKLTQVTVPSTGAPPSLLFGITGLTP